MAVKKKILGNTKQGVRAPAKMGRPKIAIDWQKVDALCQIQCTQVEICAVMGCTEDTINTRCKEEHGITFSEYLRQKAQGGRASLRRKGWKHAETHYAAWIFLAKNYLGLSDNPGNNDDRPKFDGRKFVE